MTLRFQDHNPLEHRFQGENPLRTLLYLYRGERGRLARGMVFYVIKHSPVWLMPLLTANIIDIIAQPSPSELWLNALVLALRGSTLRLAQPQDSRGIKRTGSL